MTKIFKLKKEIVYRDHKKRPIFKIETLAAADSVASFRLEQSVTPVFDPPVMFHRDHTRFHGWS